MGAGASTATLQIPIASDPATKRAKLSCPTFVSYVSEIPSYHDYLRARSIHKSIVGIGRCTNVVDASEFLDFYSPLILSYEHFYIELRGIHPDSAFLAMPMVWKIQFFSEFVTLLLSETLSDTTGHSLALATKERAQIEATNAILNFIDSNPQPGMDVIECQ